MFSHVEEGEGKWAAGAASEEKREGTGNRNKGMRELRRRANQ
jgi:hypothetical protein